MLAVAVRLRWSPAGISSTFLPFLGKRQGLGDPLSQRNPLSDDALLFFNLWCFEFFFWVQRLDLTSSCLSSSFVRHRSGGALIVELLCLTGCWSFYLCRILFRGLEGILFFFVSLWDSNCGVWFRLGVGSWRRKMLFETCAICAICGVSCVQYKFMLIPSDEFYTFKWVWVCVGWVKSCAIQLGMRLRVCRLKGWRDSRSVWVYLSVCDASSLLGRIEGKRWVMIKRRTLSIADYKEKGIHSYFFASHSMIYLLKIDPLNWRFVFISLFQDGIRQFMRQLVSLRWI